MTIDEAIEMLKREKAGGTKNIVFAYWTSDMFEKEDDDSWGAEAEYIEDQMDWSASHDDMQNLLDNYE